MTTCACGNCQFFDKSSEAAAKHKKEEAGLCRYNPPIANATPNGHAENVHGVWPVVRKNDWCGHFAATVDRFMTVAA